jgi:hypothetical protein
MEAIRREGEAQTKQLEDELARLQVQEEQERQKQASRFENVDSRRQLSLQDDMQAVEEAADREALRISKKVERLQRLQKDEAAWQEKRKREEAESKEREAKRASERLERERLEAEERLQHDQRRSDRLRQLQEDINREEAEDRARAEAQRSAREKWNTEYNAAMAGSDGTPELDPDAPTPKLEVRPS